MRNSTSSSISARSGSGITIIQHGTEYHIRYSDIRVSVMSVVLIACLSVVMWYKLFEYADVAIFAISAACLCFVCINFYLRTQDD
jgi:hypothetical protein